MTFVQGNAEERASLFAKMVTLNKSIKSLNKSGKYKSGATKYEYATEADVIEPISEAYAEAGLAVAASCIDQTWGEINGRAVCRVTVGLVVGDPDSGAYIVTHGQSAAMNGDKAPNAAFTTGLKYLLAKNALVSFGDDADAYDGSTKVGTARAAKSRVDTSELVQKIAQLGVGDKVRKYISEQGYDWNNLTIAQRDDINNYIEENA